MTKFFYLILKFSDVVWIVKKIKKVNGKKVRITRNKLTPSEQEKLASYAFEYNGEKLWASPKETARNIIVKHIGAAVPIAEFFTEKVFTPEFLEYLNENVIKPAFALPDQSSFDDIKEIEDLIETGTETSETEN